MRAENADGQMRFRLGPVEWAIVVALITAGGYCARWAATTVTEELSEQRKTIADLDKKQALTNAQLAVISGQLSTVPTLSQDVAELKVRVDRHDEDIRELRGTRGLK